MPIPLDYSTLRVIWWLLLGFILSGFAIMDGFDLGVGMLLHHVARTDTERRVVLNTIGPVWEGNQVWLVLGAGAIFAAWPDVYAVTFSGFYLPMLTVLLALILRPVSIKYRSKVTTCTAKNLCDVGIFIAGSVPALIFGMMMGNVIQGIPFHFDETLLPLYTGSIISLLNPFALLAGCLSISMLCMQGSLWLTLKTEGPIQLRAVHCAQITAFITVILFAVAGVWVEGYIGGHILTSEPLQNGVSNPLHKTVLVQTGAWLYNYSLQPLTILAPAAGFIGAIGALLFVRIKCHKKAWVAGALSIAGIIATVGISLFPFILPSSTHPEMSLTVWDASSSRQTLFIMLMASVIFVPLILLYTSWVYYVMRGKVTEKAVMTDKSGHYY